MSEQTTDNTRNKRHPINWENDVILGINQLVSMSHRVATSHGFWDDDTPNIAEKLALIHSEISEALEADRKSLMSDHITEFDGLTEELADAIIRICDLAGHKKLRLGEALIEKTKFNMNREYKHGKLY